MQPLSNFLTEEELNKQANILQTIQETLSSARELNSAFKASLSSIPVHPYDFYKQQYIEPDYVPITFEQVEAPADFCHKTCLCQISAISQQFSKNVLTQVEALSTGKVPDDCNAFMGLSATENGEEFVVDRERAGNYLKFVEMIKTIPIEAVNRNPEELAKKVISQYIKMLGSFK